mmetsp:Transcript_37795/g.55391  ORF Transcript_37795/g.55391 Transcript_37795/m.55391 type:complete len:100 (-) Transcript_37795:625-924(-)
MMEVRYKDKEHRFLYHWIRRQRERYRDNDIPEDRKAVLDEIGFDWIGDSGGPSTKNDEDNDSDNDEELSSDDDSSDDETRDAVSRPIQSKQTPRRRKRD